MLNRLWNDQAGFVVSTELILIATFLVIGMIVGLASVRDQVVQELADVAAAISEINQSYTYDGVDGHSSRTEGSNFVDLVDSCDLPGEQNGPSACVIVNIPPTNEGGANNNG